MKCAIIMNLATITVAVVTIPKGPLHLAPIGILAIVVASYSLWLVWDYWKRYGHEKH